MGWEGGDETIHRQEVEELLTPEWRNYLNQAIPKTRKKMTPWVWVGIVGSICVGLTCAILWKELTRQ